MSLKSVFWEPYICDPIDKTPVAQWTHDTITFQNGNKWPCSDGCPILIDESQSLFKIDNIIQKKTTTQNRKFHIGWRARLRKSLPSLAPDRIQEARYSYLAEEVRKLGDAPVLILGTGDKGDYYRSIFGANRVVTSDVHNQYGVDLVCDAQQIPFHADTFALVLAAQVFEHIANPWLAAKEVERVVMRNGLIQIETPFCFPYHGQFYDFYRFTPSALRFLFPESKMLRFDVSSGNGAAAAVMLESFLVNSWKNNLGRRSMMLLSRLFFWWFNYLDEFSKHDFMRSVASAKGFAVTYRWDNIKRKPAELFNDVMNLGQ